MTRDRFDPRLKLETDVRVIREENPQGRWEEKQLSLELGVVRGGFKGGDLEKD